MKHKKWELEDAFTLLKALEVRLSPIGFHAATIGTERLKKRGELHLRIYGEAGTMTLRDRENIVSLLQATEMQLISGARYAPGSATKPSVIVEGEKWSHGRGKNTRLVEIIFD